MTGEMQRLVEVAIVAHYKAAREHESGAAMLQAGTEAALRAVLPEILTLSKDTARLAMGPYLSFNTGDARAAFKARLREILV